MPSPWRERSLADSVLIAALSGRALAAAARRAGYRPLVADLFNDLDTRRIAGRALAVPGDLEQGILAGPLLESLEALAADEETQPVGLVYGAGFEDRPDLLARLAERWTVLGNGPSPLSAMKDPKRFFRLLGDLSIPHPPVRFETPPHGERWLVKSRGGSGGGHVRRARPDDEPKADRYFQKYQHGHAVSLLFLADGRDARILASHRQWSAPKKKAPFRFGGVAGPVDLSPDLAESLERALGGLVAASGLVGLNSADMIVTREDFALLEVNPRPGASLDIHDLDSRPPLFELHCRACRGELPKSWTAPQKSAASAVVYAPRRLTVPAGFRWPRWTADRGAPGTRIDRGTPICTVITTAKNPETARQRVLQRGTAILRTLEGGPIRRGRSGKTADQPTGGPTP